MKEISRIYKITGFGADAAYSTFTYKEISRLYKIPGFGADEAYYTFTYPDGHEVKFPKFYEYEVEIPNPDICNIKYTKQIVSGATHDIPI